MEQLTFLTSMNPNQLKDLLTEIVREVFRENQLTSTTNPENEAMVSIQEAAKITGLAVNTLYDKTHQRAVPHYKKGKRIYFRPSELLAWLRKGKVKTSDELEAEAVTRVVTKPMCMMRGGK